MLMTKKYILDIVRREERIADKKQKKNVYKQIYHCRFAQIQMNIRHCTVSDECHWMTSVTETDVHTIDRRTYTNTHSGCIVEAKNR